MKYTLKYLLKDISATLIKLPKCLVLFLFIILICPHINSAQAQDKREKVTLQLKWFHQFQFAGYYAALEKGFYADEGLDVTIIERDLKFDPVEQVLEGKADFGVTNSEILLKFIKGEPVVLLASIFQHSPLVFISKTTPFIHSPHDFFGKTILMNSASQDIELKAMLEQEEISLNELNLIDRFASPEDYFDPNIDIIAAYITNQPYYLDKINIPYSIIYPSTYGVDFYGDSLFTSRNEVVNNPDKVRKFIKASLKGWAYALNNPDELTDIIINKFGSLKTKEHLLYEAEKVKELISPEFVKIGHTNPGRWRHIADNFVNLGLASDVHELHDFFFDPSIGHYEFKKDTVLYIVLLFIAAISGLFCMLVVTKKLKKEVNYRKKIEEKLKQSEHYYRSLFHNTGTATVILGEDLFIKRCNSNFAELCGLEISEIENKTKWTDFVSFDELARMYEYHTTRSSNENSAPNSYEFKFIRANGEVRIVAVYVELITDTTDRVASLIDLTEKIKTQDILIQTEKMISVGGLAAGMAHEINNPLAGILQGAQNILRRLSPDYEKNITEIDETGCSFDEISSFLEKRGIVRMINGIQASGERAAEIVKNMLDFSRRSDAGRTSCDLNSIMDGIIDIISCDYDLQKKYDFKHTEIIKEYDSKLNMISCFKTEVEQVILNLVKNAAFAMSETADQRKPKLTLRTKTENEYIIIEVEDNGPGMTEEIRKRAFEPFFTTKSPGTGTGLGLSVSYFIITQNHGGIFEVESEVGKGTKFVIKIPTI